MTERQPANMPDIIGLAGMIPEFERAVATFEKIKAICWAYGAKIDAALPQGPHQANLGAVFAALAVFVPELKPLIPDILDAVATIEKAIPMLAPAPAPVPSDDDTGAWPQ